MGLKLLHSADWHLDAPMTSLPPELRRQLQELQRRIPGLIADRARQEGCDALLLAGDLFDGSPSRDTVELVKNSLGQCGMPVLISPGNHDPYAAGSPWMESWPENVHIFTGPLESLELPGLSLRVYGAGYRSMDCPPLLEGFRAEGSAACIGLFHADPTDPDSPYCPVTEAQVRESGLDYLALGHIHKSGSFRAGDTLCAWPGCPMGRGWDETGKGICYLVELDGSAEIRELPLNLPRFHDWTLDIQGDARAALEAALPASESGDLYRITLTGDGDPDIESLTEDFSGRCRYLHLRDATQAPADPWACAGEDSFQGIYFGLLRRKLEQAAPDEAEIIRLAADISRKLLDGRSVEP